nr:MAG TPA: hypothetical protein [Caudoviricetes sp.]
MVQKTKKLQEKIKTYKVKPFRKPLNKGLSKKI